MYEWNDLISVSWQKCTLWSTSDVSCKVDWRKFWKIPFLQCLFRETWLDEHQEIQHYQIVQNFDQVGQRVMWCHLIPKGVAVGLPCALCVLVYCITRQRNLMIWLLLVLRVEEWHTTTQQVFCHFYAFYDFPLPYKCQSSEIKVQKILRSFWSLPNLTPRKWKVWAHYLDRFSSQP